MSEFLQKILTVATLGVAVSLSLGACASVPAASLPPSSAPSESETPAFPVTLVHSEGETTLDEAPVRVVAIGMEQTDALLALGVAPVATEDSWGYIWRVEKLTEIGAGEPGRLVNSDRVEDALADLAHYEPDLTILSGPASYGNALLEEGYLRLPEIAPTLYPTDVALDPRGFPSGVSWREAVTQSGAALGKNKEAAELLDSIDKSLAEHAAAHPEFAGKTIAIAGHANGSFNVSEDTTAMALVLKSLGFVPLETSTIDHLDDKGIAPAAPLSPEQAALIDADVILIPDAKGGHFDTESGFALSPAYAHGVVLYGDAYGDTTSGQTALRVLTALSISWGIDAFVDELATALK